MKMMMKSLAAAVLAIGAAGTAQAGAEAQSVLQVLNVNFLNATTGVKLDISAFDIIKIVDTTNLNPTLTPGGSNSYSNFSVGGAPLAQTVVCFPVICDPALNPGTPFANAVFPASVDGAMGASSLDGNPITGVPLPGTGAQARTSSLAQRVTTGAGNTTASLTLASTFSFSTTADTAVIFDFDAIIHMLASADTAVNAIAGTGWNIKVVNALTGATAFQWTPNGATGDLFGITGGTEQVDSCNLTSSISRFGPNPAALESDCSGHFRATSELFLASQTYDLSISHQTQANVLVAARVPEPSTILLGGLGLLGMGFAARRKQVRGS